MCRWLGLPCLYCNNSCTENTGTNVDDNGDASNNDTNENVLHVLEYRSLSPEQKENVDSIRINSIRRCLSQFSSLLGKEHMVRLTRSSSEADVCATPLGAAVEEAMAEATSLEMSSSSGTDITDWESSSSENDRNDASSNNSREISYGTDTTDTETENEKERLPVTSADHVEIGMVIKNDYDEDSIEQELQQKNQSLQEEADTAVSECTHIIIPCPGHTIVKTNISYEKNTMTGECCTHTDDILKETKKSRFAFRKASNTTTPKNDKLKSIISTDSSIETTSKEQNPPITTITHNSQKQRTVPIFCAICLEQYLPSNTISWSSNNKCTHVFHKDCIVQWLVSLGRIKWKNNITSTNEKNWALFLSEKQLMQYDLECPCCRQAFIEKGVVLGKVAGMQEEAFCA